MIETSRRMERRLALVVIALVSVVSFAIHGLRPAEPAVTFGSAVLFVRSVSASAAFYEAAFRMKVRILDEAAGYAELDTGTTTLAFAEDPGRTRSHAHQVEISLSTNDVAGAYARALAAGGTGLTPPSEDSGALFATLSDPDGVVIELRSARPSLATAEPKTRQSS